MCSILPNQQLYSHMKYSKHSKHSFLPNLSLQATERKRTGQRQAILTEQVKQIDRIVKTDHLHVINNLIFTGEVKNRLSTDILECVSKQYRLLAYGFQVLKGDYDHRVVRKDIVVSTETFKHKLHHISIKSLEKYQYQKHKQLQKLYQSISKVNTKEEPRLYRRLRRKQAKQAQSSQGQPEYNYHMSKRIVSEQAEPPLEITEEDISKLLKKLKSIITIWLPPKTYPQFYGIIVPSLSTGSSGARCRIKRYIFFKQGLNEQFFMAVLEFAKQFFGVHIVGLEMIMTKANYLGYFKNCGWGMKSWEGFDKIYASFPTPH